MKKISEMDLDELRDYAVKLEDEKNAGAQREKDLGEQITKLTERNQILQDRNNNLFMQVEQSRQPGADPTPAPAPAVSCEDFARSIANKI